MTVPSPPPPAQRPGLRARLRRGLTAATLVTLGLAGLGQVVRDPTVGLAQLFYLPLLPLGVATAVLDLACAGRGLPRPRFALALIGAAATGLAVGMQCGWGAADAPIPGRPTLTVVQWNVHGGGGRHAWNVGSKRCDADTWAALCAALRAPAPDLVILAEAPMPATGWLDQFVREQGWAVAHCENPRTPAYWYSLAVAAPGPVRLDYERPIAHGHVLAATVTWAGRPVRVLVVDGESSPLLSRRELLADVDALRAEAARAGRPFDLVAGDFNTPRRSRGFDALRADGYRLATDASRGWRPTFPSNWPLYDIDHVWAHPNWAVVGCDLLDSSYTDHRGQAVRLQWAAAD